MTLGSAHDASLMVLILALPLDEPIALLACARDTSKCPIRVLT